MTPLAQKLEAVLFSEGEPVSLKRLASLLECNPTELDTALAELASSLQGRGLALIRTETSAALSVAAESADAVKKAQEKDLGREIGDAGLEVLAIILYRGPSTRAQVDFIRGVNTSSTMRNLLSRGLVERAENPSDSREYLYRPTAELLAHLGVVDTKSLPDYATIVSELAAFEQKNQSSDTHGSATSSVLDAAGN